MNKYRVVVDGNGRFKVQQKTWFLWVDMGHEHSFMSETFFYTDYFDSKKKAEEYIEGIKIEDEKRKRSKEWTSA